MTTENILFQLKNGQLDAALLATPLDDHGIKEIPLFYESFVAYVSKNSPLFKKKTLGPDEIIAEELWLLNEGHCLRSQILNICQKNLREHPNFEYETGSVEALKRIVELNKGITILPELCIYEFAPEQMEMVRYFNEPEPVREISLVSHRNIIKQKIIAALKEEILSAIPDKMKIKDKKQIVEL